MVVVVVVYVENPGLMLGRNNPELDVGSVGITIK